MNSKSKVLLSSIASIALCSSIAVGGTFALFTSEQKVNVAVTAGKVKVTAEIVEESLKTSSSLSTFNYQATEENGYTANFENGGTATFSNADGVQILKLTNVTPGDKAEFQIKATNESNVAIQYRFTWTVDGELGNVLQATVNGEALVNNVTEWTKWENNAAELSQVFNVVVLLPETVDSTYQEKEATISFMVEAVQGNAKIVPGVAVSNFEQFKLALEKGGDIKLTDNISISEALTIPANTTIYGQGYTISRAAEFAGTVFTAKAGVTVTLEDIIVDGGAVWSGEIDPTLQRGTNNTGVTATGNLIATESNSSVILNEGAILQNNVGAYAVNLGTRIGATLTVNGGQIINNESGSGAIWGGGNIVINENSKLNGNSSTGIGGVIRMVSNCNLSINGGEINHNKAAGDGGVIWGYGSSTYTFTGGEMAYNESNGVGGAIYTGTYSVINISGDFEMHDNKATNSGAIRLTDYTSLTMTGGKIYNNTQNGSSNAFNTWNNSISITGGSISDDFSYLGGLALKIGAADIDGVIHYALATNHNTAYLDTEFNAFTFTVDEENTNFSNFNFKPANGYVYTQGDEAKLVCLNTGYTTYWDASTGTFRLQADN